jgi:hypothetical protein
MATKYALMNANSGLYTSTRHPYNDQAVPAKTYDTPGEAEAARVLLDPKGVSLDVVPIVEEGEGK